MLGHRSSMRGPAAMLAVAAFGMHLLTAAGPAAAVPVGAGFEITVYDSLPDPAGLAFAPDGSLYVGRDNSGSGGGNADSVRIHRIPPGGGSHSEYGARSTWDPDALIVDPTGAYSGVAGSVVLGGRPAGSTTGVVSAIRPDQSVATLAGPNAVIVNPSDFVIDGAGRMLYTDYEGTGAVRQLSGGSSTVFFSPGTGNRDIDVHPTTGEIYLRNTAVNTIRRYSATGTLLGTLATGITGSGLAIGTGGAWGTSVYVASATHLIRVNSASSLDTIATGFGNVWNIEFGPGDALYVSDFASDKVYRVRFSTASVHPGVRVSGLRLALVGAQPSSGDRRLSLTVPRAGRASVRLFDVSGRVVATLLDGVVPAGEQEVAWSGRSSNGRPVAPGVYLARAITADGTVSTRVVQLR
jgi:hypothetical protein